jgi:hypothetical protein
MTLVVLDELDRIETSDNEVLYQVSTAQSVSLFSSSFNPNCIQLFQWASVPSSTLVLLGIANALDLTGATVPATDLTSHVCIAHHSLVCCGRPRASVTEAPPVCARGAAFSAILTHATVQNHQAQTDWLHFRCLQRRARLSTFHNASDSWHRPKCAAVGASHCSVCIQSRGCWS